MSTRDKYLNEKVISLKGYEHAKKANQKKQAIANDDKINKICDLVISSSMHYKNGLFTREEYIKSLKMALKRI